MRRLIAFGAAVAATLAIATPAHAGGDIRYVAGGKLALAPHSVVVYSQLPHCANEDASGGPLPCTWNVTHTINEPPSTDGNGRGAALWNGRNGGVHYVWNDDPVVTHDGHRTWVSDHYRHRHALARDCWINRTTHRIGCPDGTRITYH